ncbi:alpha-L-arabinofuranosidase C-terminal domain-containing protein [Mangrovibacterium diazotrophicum]|uniref:non-reducing end alpha-L-arabinofuranosidase n=1 Tax=Mangrovibacterium diazotrophicum TaxID=1261403 RepID=A0A419W842_9BACT|nr:alpha-L-arabinofuranosidase C-terminal domain-containing protein [Mangrovibacterium diazotrophicum]RKD91643.1 alpha-L-arabinofuranosidase [Mangrovibacterium diazotrophicum]
MKLQPIIFLFLAILFGSQARANEPDSAYVFSYATLKDKGHNGLHYAWSVDRKHWQGIGPEFRFLFCDFGTWGSQKRMITPFLFQDQKGTWHEIWSLNEAVGQFAHAETNDLFTWEPQEYPEVMTKGNVMLPEVSYQPAENNYIVTWLSDQDGEQKVFKATTTDFKTYAETIEGSESDRLNAREEVMIDGEKQLGVVAKVSWSQLQGAIQFYELTKYHEQQRAERLTDDATRYPDLKPLDAEITAIPEDNKAISDMLIGVFFEDINYAADGGLYAELVQNRGFEYTPADTKNRNQDWNSSYAWSFTGQDDGFTIDTVAPVHPNQKHYAVLTVANIGDALQNEGFDGIALKAGDKYDFSVFAKGLDGAKGKFLVRLVDENGKVFAEGTSKSVGADWKKLMLTVTAKGDVDKAHLKVIPQFTGKVALDLVSLFPEKTFKGRKNGLRADLAQTITDLHPRFVRFPGGCVSHGDGLDNIYRWKNTIGPLETRKGDRNIWNYHQSMGLGYFEYFQFCEDIGAQPLPVIAAGVPCQNSSTGGYGQQGGIPMCDMDQYVQDILDLIEWANGDKNTKWGKLRAEAGHPDPFNLKYVGIGNEDLINDIFEERFTMIFNAIKEKHPEITVIGTVGPFSEGTDYRVGWEIASKLQVPLVDEHYYQPPGWYLNNQDYYDRYDRSKPKVYLGEYATHIPGRKLTTETALCDALHLINVERNADVVHMTSYAPLLAKHGHTQWNPDLVYFNNTEVFLTPDYYVQMMFGQNSGEEYIASQLSLSDNAPDVKKRVVSSLVRDAKTGDYILKVANLLPVAVNAKINLADLPIIAGDADLTILAGEVSDLHAEPENKTISVSADFEYNLPAYSFSVIRMKSN